MRLVISFPGHLPDAAVQRIRRSIEESATPEDWRALVLDEGGIAYDLDSPLTIIVDSTGRTVIEQEG